MHHFVKKNEKKTTFQNFEIRKKFSKKNFGVQKKPPPLIFGFFGVISPMIQLLTPNSFVYFRQ
tara:strand:+ start:90 stop:278 length:189 start_codon:yes stop_codon:yes gene_type:complete